jgi:hypothetical protein
MLMILTGFTFYARGSGNPLSKGANLQPIWRRSVTIVHVILAGESRVTVHDPFDHPVVLQFGAGRNYLNALWVIPSYPRQIPTWRLSEIRVEDGPLSVLIDGPEGFRSGPHDTTWVRNHYPTGKDCALLNYDSDSRTLGGVTLTIVEDSLIVDAFPRPDTSI